MLVMEWFQAMFGLVAADNIIAKKTRNINDVKHSMPTSAVLEAVGFNASTAIGTKIHISVDRITRPVKFWFSLFIDDL